MQLKVSDPWQLYWGLHPAMNAMPIAAIATRGPCASAAWLDAVRISTVDRPTAGRLGIVGRAIINRSFITVHAVYCVAAALSVCVLSLFADAAGNNGNNPGGGGGGGSLLDRIIPKGKVGRVCV